MRPLPPTPYTPTRFCLAGVILDVHFPMVVYKKLLGAEPTFDVGGAASPPPPPPPPPPSCCSCWGRHRRGCCHAAAPAAATKAPRRTNAPACHVPVSWLVPAQDLRAAFPELGRGLQQLLDYEGDVESVFCRK